MSPDALQQRKANGERKRYFNAMRILNDKLSFKTDESKLINEIVEHMSKVFSFADLAAIFHDDYVNMVEQDEETQQLRADVHTLSLQVASLKEESMSQAAEIAELHSKNRKLVKKNIKLGRTPLSQAAELETSTSPNRWCRVDTLPQ
jgi:hypothetical protein